MLTAAQITAGADRLVDGKLTQDDVDQFVTAFRMTFGSLEGKYNYKFEAKLEALDDTGNTEMKAAQVAACAIKMEELGFGVSSLQGGKSALYYKEEDEYRKYVLIAFSKIYPIPEELSSWDLRRRFGPGRASQTAFSSRKEKFW